MNEEKKYKPFIGKIIIFTTNSGIKMGKLDGILSTPFGTSLKLSQLLSQEYCIYSNQIIWSPLANSLIYPCHLIKTITKPTPQETAIFKRVKRQYNIRRRLSSFELKIMQS